MSGRCPPPVDTRKALDFLRTSGLVDLSLPLEQVVAQISELEDVAGYVLAWEKYVLVVAAAAEREGAGTAS